MRQIPVLSNSNYIQPCQGLNKKNHIQQVNFPISAVQKLDKSNKTIQKYNQHQSNLQSKAWEQHLLGELPEIEPNFIQNFYINHDDPHQGDVKSYYHGQLLDIFKQSSQTAYDQAKLIVQNVIAEEMIKTANLKKSKIKMKERIHHTLTSSQYQKEEQYKRWRVDLRRLYGQMREAVQHILDAEGERQFQRLHFLIEQKKHINQEFINHLPKTKSKEILEYLQSIRQLLSKKTDEVTVLQQIYGEEFSYDDKTVKDLSQSYRGGDDSTSMLSEKLTVSRSLSKRQKRKQEEQKIEKFMNLKCLKEKWRIQDEDKLREVIRRRMVQEALSDAEHLRAKQYRSEQEKIQKISKATQGLKKMKKEKSKKDINATKRKSKVDMKRLQSASNDQQNGFGITFNQGLHKKEKLVREFMDDYTYTNTLGACFNKASQYAQLFN